MSLTDYARQQLLRGRVVVHKTRQLDHAVFDQLRRIGVNLNQLTYLAQRHKELPGHPAITEIAGKGRA